jgi:DNA repair exonuclease SbcCD ATPase subunit
MWRIAGHGLLIVIAVLAGTAQAQSTRQGNDGLARMQAAMQQLSAERTTLQGEKTKLEARVAELEKQLAAAQDENKSVSAQLTRSQAAEQQATANGEALNERLKQAHDRTDELVAHFRETAPTLQQQLAASSQQLAAGSQQLDVCTQRNVALYGVGMEVLDRYEEQGLLERHEAEGPFTQLARRDREPGRGLPAAPRRCPLCGSGQWRVTQPQSPRNNRPLSCRRGAVSVTARGDDEAPRSCRPGPGMRSAAGACRAGACRAARRPG